MNRTTVFDPPAIVKPASNLAELAGRINAEHHQVETALRAGLQHAKNAGDLLTEAKRQCRHGEWLKWLGANVRFTDRTARRYMTIASRLDELTTKSDTVSDLSYKDALRVLTSPAEEAADANTQRVSHLPAVHLPALKPGRGYMVDGKSDRFGKCFATIDPHPDDPGYWTFCFSFGIDAPWAFSEYCGRGMRLDANSLARIMSNKGFVPVGPWEETDADPDPPQVQWYREDFRSRTGTSCEATP